MVAWWHGSHGDVWSRAASASCHTQVMPIKSKLMAHMDKLDQTPLHKAAWLADENVVSLSAPAA